MYHLALLRRHPYSLPFISAKKQGPSLSSSLQVSSRYTWKGPWFSVLSQEPTWSTELPAMGEAALPKRLPARMKGGGGRALDSDEEDLQGGQGVEAP